MSGAEQEAELTPAAFDERAAAFLLDWVAMKLAVTALASAFGAATGFRFGSEQVAAGATVLFFAALAAYHAVGTARGGSTMGKGLMGIRVVGLDGPVSPGRSVLRVLVYPLSLAPLGLGFFWMLIDGRGRAWQDLAAGTAVVREGTERRRGRLQTSGILAFLLAFSLLSRLLR